MAGHNKWSKVKRPKSALDAKRGKLFSKLAEEITLAARTGGGSPDGNPRLRSAVQAARGVSMANARSERASEGGTGEAAIEEMACESYGPGLERRKGRLKAEAMKMTYVADNRVAISDEQAAAPFLRLSDAREDNVEDNDDVQHVHANAEIAKEILSKISG